MIKHFRILSLVALAGYSQAQTLVKGSATDSTGGPIAFCAVGLMNAADSSLIKGNVSDSAGIFIFEKVKNGSYFINYRAVGYKESFSSVFTLDSVMVEYTVPPQNLSSAGVNLTEVSVTAYKPLIEFKKGMVVMNVDADLLAKGNTILELLRRIPGVIVDAQNNITINGIGGARFLIDDRLQQMPAPQVIDMLAAMSADAVSKIELIKNPPARYDASGTGGLINIVTKKAQLRGFNGNVWFGASQGKRLRWGPTVNLNYKSKKISLFSNFWFAEWNGISTPVLERTLTTNGSTEYIHSLAQAPSTQHILSGYIGAEYDLTPTTLLGLYVNSGFNDDDWFVDTRTEISNSSSFNYSRLRYHVDENYKIASPNYNLTLHQKIDTTGGQLKLSVGYNNYLEKHTKLIDNHFYDYANSEVAPSSHYNTYNDRDYKVLTQKLDFNKTLSNKILIEAGAKGSFADNYNASELRYSNYSTGLFIGDTTFYNDYRYKEGILAGYATLSKSWKKIGLSFGLRGEQTYIDAADLRSTYVLRRSYFNFFPSGSVDFTFNEKHTLSASYGYRIERPHYGMLNPLRIINEQLNYGVGNPQLNPQYAHNIALEHNFNQFIAQSVGFNKTKDFPFFYSYTPAGSKVNIDTVFNFPARTSYHYNVSAQKRIKWYNFQTYAIVVYRTMHGSINGQDVSTDTYQFYFNLNQEVYLPKDFKLQLWCGRGSGFRDGPQYYNPRSAIHFSIHKTFLNKSLSVTLSFHDLMYKDWASYTSRLSGQSLYYADKWDSRRVRIAINYRFGKMRIEQRLNTETDSRIKGGK